MSDLALTRRKDGQFDLVFENGDLQMGESLESAVLISVGSDARAAEKNFENTLQDDGWWGEPTFEGDKWGSLLHTLSHQKNNPNTLLLAKQYAKDSLQWLIDDGVAKTINVDVALENNVAQIEIVLSNGDKAKNFRYEILWDEVA